MTRPRLLLTGFGPFPGAPRNPTADVVAQLSAPRHGERLGVEIVAHVFATTWTALDGLDDLLRRTHPDAVLHLGLKRRATAVTVERFGRNRVSTAAVDAAGRRPAVAVLDPDAPPRAPVTLPVRAIAARIAAAGAPVTISDDAGRYLCNGLLWRSLRLADGRPTGFLHLPPAGSTTAAGPRFTLDALIATTAAAIGVVATRLHRQP